ncbi:MAG: hypothetical protein M1826_005265 [Phylliscum demangeonii]|nr:MAG: hypothetical protein M1826_005265 [Phylliscum demangeonii]
MSPRQASLPEALFRSFLGHQAYFYLGLIVLYVVYYRFLHPLSKVPGPFWASLSRLWLVKHARSGEMHRTAIALHRRYGPLVRTGPNEVSVSDPQAVKMIYGLATKFPKSNWYRVWQGKRKFDLFAERNESIHTSQRRLVSNLYSMAAVKELEASFDKAITVFVQRMTEQQGRVVDMALWLQLFAFDIIGEITFSKPFGFMKAGKEDGSFRQIDNALRSAIWVGQVPWLYRLNEMLTPLIGNRLAINSRHGGIRQLALREVEQRQGQASSRPDLLAHLFEVQKKKPTEMNDDGVLSMATSNVFAGSDTSAITLRTILYYALKDARVKARLVDEVDRMQHDGQLSNPVTYNQSVAMPYLQAYRLGSHYGHPLPCVIMVLPENPDCFREEYDEESCRDFLVHELGAEIARFYRYAEGIHEVQKRIILRYGDENCAQAMHIFRELLEADDNASGLGDDGDVWRSWRHDHMLRPNSSRRGKRSKKIIRNLITGNMCGLLSKEKAEPMPEMARDDEHGQLPAHQGSQSGPSYPAVLGLDGTGDYNGNSGPDDLAEENDHFRADQHHLMAKGQTGAMQPLPLQPGNGATGHHGLPQVAMHAASYHTPAHPASNISPGPPTHSTSLSTREIFRILARELHNGHAGPLSPSTQREFNLDPVKYSPLDYGSIVDLAQIYNPYTPLTRDGIPAKFPQASSIASEQESEQPNSGVLRESPTLPLPVTKYDAAHRQQVHGLAQSRSESHISSLINTSGKAKSRAVHFRDEAQVIAPVRGRHRQGSARKDDAYMPELKEETMMGSPVRRSRSPMKKMFGENGWLSRGSSVKEISSVRASEAKISPPKGRMMGFKQLSEKIKQRVEEMRYHLPTTATAPTATAQQTPPSLHTQTQDRIRQRQSSQQASISMPDQAYLYSEIEFMLVASADEFLMKQRKLGRMSHESLVRIEAGWRAKGRHAVSGFHFDQGTQRDLAILNIRTFHFYEATGPLAQQSDDERYVVNSALYAWKQLIKEMAHRTFCNPDNVVRRHFRDARNVLELVGARHKTLLAFDTMHARVLSHVSDHQCQRELLREKARRQVVDDSPRPSFSISHGHGSARAPPGTLTGSLREGSVGGHSMHSMHGARSSSNAVRAKNMTSGHLHGGLVIIEEAVPAHGGLQDEE